MTDHPDSPTFSIERDDSAASIHDDYRSFVGGGGPYWDEIADLQARFLIDQGLKPDHVFLDVACGALRAGTRLIPYLNRGHYLGIDKHIELIIYGVALEVGTDVFRDKQPRFAITDSFDFSRLPAKPDFGIAQSLFSHLSPADIGLCLRRLLEFANPGCRFFATFFEKETGSGIRNPESSHSHGMFYYTRAEMEAFGAQAGWQPIYIGEWSHPRGQRIFEFRAPPKAVPNGIAQRQLASQMRALAYAVHWIDQLPDSSFPLFTAQREGDGLLIDLPHRGNGLRVYCRTSDRDGWFSGRAICFRMTGQLDRPARPLRGLDVARAATAGA